MNPIEDEEISKNWEKRWAENTNTTDKPEVYVYVVRHALEERSVSTSP